MEPFTFASSSELRIPVAVKVKRLEGHEKPLPYSTLLKRPDLRHRGSNLSPNSELYITVQPFSDSKPLTVHSQTPYKHFKNGRVWNQWLTLPVNYSTLPANTQLAITIWDLSPINPRGGDKNHHIPFGGTTVPLFDEEAMLRMGRQKCKVWRHKAADGFSDTTTPWQEPRKRGRRGQQEETVTVDEKQSRRDAELERLVGLMKKHEMGEIPESKWLDQMVFRQIEKLERQQVKDSTRPKYSAKSVENGDTEQNGDPPPPQCAEGDPDHIDGSFSLYIEFPRFDHPIIFTDHEYPPPPISSIQIPASQPTGAVNFKPPPEVHLGPGIHSDANDTSTDGGGLIRIYDPEVGYADNPAEAKHRRLIRGQRNALDRDLKPNPKMRDFLNKVMSYGPTVELSDKEKDEVWRFRHHLTRDKRALTKLVKSVNWNEATEARQAIALLPKWAEIDIDDALELLGPGVRNPAVRAYAVDRLRKADDEELLLYLLQLVQALKFEPRELAKEAEDADMEDSSLASFLIARSAANLKLGNFLHWYLMVELDSDGTPPAQPLAKKSAKKLFARVSYDFMKELEATPEGQARRKVLLRQGEFITVLSKISKDVRNSRGDRPKKIELLRKLLADPKNDMLHFETPLPLPLDPTVKVTGVLAEECSVFKSSLFPLHLTFMTATGEKYPLMFKMGDDLRQDQLVIQIIMLMDRLLLNENLDLKLTPYRILATSTHAGAIQFIPSTALSSILTSAKYKNSILGYLRFHNPASSSPSAPAVLGVRKEAMDTYIKSLAGYCVITYLLGVGDRHLDNLLLAPDGHFFHIDFGYILGRDPKPMAPLMKLTGEMVEGMGGASSLPESQFELFKQYCFTTYATLRRSSSLILNLFALMRDADISGLRFFEGEEGVRKVEERFRLEGTEEEALGFLGGLIEREMGSWGGVVIDKLHGFAMGWRA
ncbi:Phosphatidylinositol (PI) 3-kinase [Vermiconidia calcicola]|uniref:Phosphatidylinositol (PI) 3-kinase n=1 Tax=Vermiconidia calcicola TaxID=1690605 RepID=A0ACC3MTT3_9PEZI|nr:Phosphatidylinositol (PI) 3-kinase [Vermiconidia calcicola]